MKHPAGLRVRKPKHQPEQAQLQSSIRDVAQTRNLSRKIQNNLPVNPVLAAESLQTPEAILELQQTLGNQQVARLAGQVGTAEIFRQEAETAAPPESTETAAEGGRGQAAAFRYAGFRERHVRSLEEDAHFQEARATGMIDIRVWERRQSTRILRTAEQSSAFYDWLEKKVSNFPGRLRLNDNQYWELNPNSGRLRLVTVHVALEIPGEEGQPPGPGVVGTEQDSIYARYYEIYGPTAPWVTPEEARMRVWQADPEEARRMRARELMPQYLLWLAVGGERREEGYKIPATWYLNQQPDRLNWSLNEYFTLKAMHGATERMRAMPVLAEASANLTNFILTFPVATIKEMAEEGIKFAAEFFFDQLMDYLEEHNLVSKDILDALRVSKETILGLLEFKNLFEALLSDKPDADKGQDAIDFVNSLFGRVSAIAEVARGEAEPAPTVEVGMDDAGFWSECGQTRLQEKYFYHFVASNLTYLRDFLASEGVTDEDVYMILAREAERMKNSYPLFEE